MPKCLCRLFICKMWNKFLPTFDFWIFLVRSFFTKKDENWWHGNFQSRATSMSTARLNWHCICKIPCPLLPGLFLKTATPSRRTRAPASCQGQLSTRSWSRSSWRSSKSWGPARTWRAGGACSRCSRRIGWDDRTTRNTRAGPGTTSCSRSWPTDRSKVRIRLRSEISST